MGWLYFVLLCCLRVDDPAQRLLVVFFKMSTLYSSWKLYISLKCEQTDSLLKIKMYLGHINTVFLPSFSSVQICIVGFRQPHFIIYERPLWSGRPGDLEQADL